MSTPETMHDATEEATHDATEEATHDATEEATHDATEEATHDATEEATHDATEALDAEVIAWRTGEGSTSERVGTAIDFTASRSAPWWRFMLERLRADTDAVEQELRDAAWTPCHDDDLSAAGTTLSAPVNGALRVVSIADLPTSARVVLTDAEDGSLEAETRDVARGSQTDLVMLTLSPLSPHIVDLRGLPNIAPSRIRRDHVGAARSLAPVTALALGLRWARVASA